MYKGQDLDLRTPSENQPGGDHPFSLTDSVPSADQFDETSDRGPISYDLPTALNISGKVIWVDSAVLELSHQAYDLAAVHGAEKVGLEHLVHALTQNEATSVALYEHNIHVSGLRRETVAQIVEGSPVLGRDTRSFPQRSPEYEEVLTHAADLAYARRSPVTTEDIIDTLFDMSRDTTRTILQRHRTDFDLRDTTGSLGGRTDDGRQKVRVSAGSHHIGESHRIPTGVPTVTDTLQNTRMDSIERAIRSLTEDMARNRETFSSLVDELRDGNNNGIPDILERPTNGHVNPWDDDAFGEISYLFGRMESNVEAKFKELARAWSVLGDRLKALESVVEEIDTGSTTPFELTADLDMRLKALAKAVNRIDEFENLLTSLPQQLTEMERRLKAQVATDGPSALDIERLTDKIENVERLIKDSDGAVELGPVMSSLRDVEAGLRGVGGQLREVDSRAGDFNLLLEGVNERHHRMEEVIEAQQGQISELLRIVRDGIDGAGIVNNGGDREAVAASVGSVVAERFSGLSAQLLQRIGQLEEQVRGSLERPVVVNGTGGETVDTTYLNDAVAKIINNQHTLAGSIDDWRAQSREDISTITMRMDRIENKPVTAELPEERFIEISDRLKHIQSTMPNRQNGAVQVETDGWTRFKMWLFGTSDWYGESWGGVREDEGGVWQAPRRAEDQVTGQQAPSDTRDPRFERNV